MKKQGVRRAFPVLVTFAAAWAAACGNDDVVENITNGDGGGPDGTVETLDATAAADGSTSGTDAGPVVDSVNAMDTGGDSGTGNDSGGH